MQAAVLGGATHTNHAHPVHTTGTFTSRQKWKNPTFRRSNVFETVEAHFCQWREKLLNFLKTATWHLTMLIKVLKIMTLHLKMLTYYPKLLRNFLNMYLKILTWYLRIITCCTKSLFWDNKSIFHDSFWLFWDIQSMFWNTMTLIWDFSSNNLRYKK